MTSPSMADNDFVLFELPVQFAQSASALRSKWTQLQSQAHPDKFASEGAAAQRLALQWSVRINEAYQRLKSPLKRAQYLCELAGHPIAAEINTAMPSAFLIQQIEWREALDEVQNASGAEALLAQIDEALQSQWKQLEAALDVDRNLTTATLLVRQIMFLDKLAAQAAQAVESQHN